MSSKLDEAYEAALRDAKKGRSRKKKPQYSGWFIVDDDFVLGYRKGSQQLLKKTKRGIPSGAISFASKAEAENEIGFLDRWGHWPGFIPDARAEKLTWS